MSVPAENFSYSIEGPLGFAWMTNIMEDVHRWVRANALTAVGLEHPPAALWPSPVRQDGRDLELEPTGRLIDARDVTPRRWAACDKQARLAS